MPKTLPECLRDLEKELPLTLSRDEAASVLRISTRTFDRRVRRGELKVIKADLGRGGGVLVTRGEVLRWMTEHVSEA